MSSVNKVIIIGNLTRKPELRHTRNGTAVTTLSIATNDRRKIEGVWQDVAEFHDAILFDRPAENCCKFLDKGRQVYVEGRLQTRKYTDKNGNDRRKTEILVDNVQFLGGKDGSRRNTSSSNNAPPKAPKKQSQDSGFSGPEEDIPF
ncbi:MAG: single-stranded DNA-binding protein [Proteobacteria bacterium]|nr:single-stranded DNA-binding protein [Pseudomonadota bacterium]|tara:strand:+ start:203 stop:640 length:438 start_codon:yes stop_codon:yes gene_type:complete